MNVETCGWNHMMQIQFLDESERLVVQPKGRLEAGDGDTFVSAVEQQLKAATKSVTIDLEQLEFVNFGGIRAILRLARSLKTGQRSLEFIRGGEAVREALDLAGLDDLFPFTPPYSSTGGTQNANRTP
jgi:anti-sigma B factor antagonist